MQIHRQPPWTGAANGAELRLGFSGASPLRTRRRTGCCRPWGVTRRRALQYCKEDRIPGALKLGNSWMIPIDAKKPADMRQVQKNKKASILLIPILIDEDEWLEETVISEGKYSSIAIQAERERAFFRGDFESAIVKSISNADMRPKFSELLFTTHGRSESPGRQVLGRPDREKL